MRWKYAVISEGRIEGRGGPHCVQCAGMYDDMMMLFPRNTIRHIVIILYYGRHLR